MKLEKYLEGMLEIRGKKEVRPASLELPDSLLREFADLYEISEKEGVEHGGPVFFDPDNDKVFVGPTRSGTATSMSIPTSNLDSNIGNVHTHPSESIGHKGGHSAHSMQDLLVFEKESDKPFFIQFVVAGPKVYAIIYVKDISVFDTDVRKLVNKLKDSVDDRAKTYAVEYHGGWEKYDDEIATFDKAGQLEEYIEQLKHTTPGFGKMMERMSIEDCLQVVRQFKYTFYEAETSSLFNSRTMKLVT